jgi:hypothetical protein
MPRASGYEPLALAIADAGEGVDMVHPSTLSKAAARFCGDHARVPAAAAAPGVIFTGDLAGPRIPSGDPAGTSRPRRSAMLTKPAIQG